jgi:hypothetical protein
MNIDHRLYVALSSDSAPEDVSKAEMVNYLADAADASWSYALTWYDDWLAKQEAVDAQGEVYGCMADWDKGEAPAEGYISEDPMIDAELKNERRYSLKMTDAEFMRQAGPSPWEPYEAPLDRLQRLGQEMDAINPPHYQSESGVECIDGLQACSTDEEYKGHLRLTTIAYLWRLGRKDDALQDAKKAAWYLDRLIAELELEKGCE